MKNHGLCFNAVAVIAQLKMTVGGESGLLPSSTSIVSGARFLLCDVSYSHA